MAKRKRVFTMWKRTISLTTASAVLVAMLPVAAPLVYASVTGEVKEADSGTDGELIKAGSLCATGDTMTVGQPFSIGTGGSYSFRIPCLISMERGDYQGNLVAAADARYTTPGDGGGLDTIASVSEDGGMTWNYSFPIWFPDSEGYASKNATTVIDPALVEGPDGEIYCMADVNPTGITTHYAGISEGNGYVEIDGEEYLALTDDYSKASVNPESNNTDYAYYVGDFNGGYAPVLKRSDGSITDWRVDEWYNIEKKVNGQFAPIKQTQVNTDQEIQQNVFYKGSELHVYNIGYIWVVESWDGGKSWENPRIINDQVKAKTGENAILVSPGKGITTTEGVITVPFYSFYGGQQKASFIYSTDGYTWKRTNTVNHLPEAKMSSESEMVELSDGTLRMFSRTAKNALNKICYTDAIETEDGEYEMGDMVATDASAWSDCNLSAVRYSEKSDGKDIVLVSCPSGNGRDLGKIYVFLVNNDEEKTMELVNTFDVKDPEGSTEFAYSCMAEQSDGQIGILFEPTRSGYIGEKPYRLVYDSYHILEIAPELTISGVSRPPQADNVKEIILEKGASRIIEGEEASVESGDRDAVRIDEVTRYFLCDDKTSSAVNKTALLENALMTFTEGKSEGSYRIKNEFINHYLTNSNNYQIYYFNPIPEDMTIEKIQNGDGAAFRVKNKNSENYVCYSATGNAFDRMGTYDAGQAGIRYDFALLRKKEAAADGDLIPGYERISEIVPGEAYLMVCVHEGNTVVLYPYAEDCASWASPNTIWNDSKRKRVKYFKADVSAVNSQKLTGLVPGETVEVTVDDTLYRIQVETPMSAEAVQAVFLDAQKEAASYLQAEQGDYSSVTWNRLQDVCRRMQETNLSTTEKKDLMEELNRAKDGLDLIDRTVEEQKAKEEIKKAENDYTSGKLKYTEETFVIFQKAYEALNAALMGTGEKVGAEELQNLYLALEKAQNDLKEKPPTSENKGEDQKQTIEEGKSYAVGDYSYKVTSLSNQTASVDGLANQALKKLQIAGTVTLGDKNYSITAIDDEAFKDCKNVTQVTITANIETIGSNAFSGCKKLTKVTINSTKLKKIGQKAFYKCSKLKNITLKTKKLAKIEKDAFKGIHKKAAVKVPAGKYNAYKKRFKNVKFKK